MKEQFRRDITLSVPRALDIETEKAKYDAPVENGARLDRGVGRPLVDPNRPHGAVTIGGGAPSLALVRKPTLRFCPAGLEATGIAAGERRSPSRSWGTGQARKRAASSRTTNARGGPGPRSNPGHPPPGLRIHSMGLAR